MRRKKIAVIGGGTGLSTMLKGIKKYTPYITAIVTMADNGGSSGKLREEMGIIPPGDIRNCLVALANTEPIMEKLLQYRFKEGSLEGQNFGNLLIATLTDITGSFEKAVYVTSRVLSITGSVLPVTLEDVHLCARFEDNMQIKGETEIVTYGKKNNSAICHIELEPRNPKPTHKMYHALTDADLIILGPGSLYTSIIPNLLVEKMCDWIRKSPAKKVYISNIMTQPGETSNLTLEEHIQILESYLGREVLDVVVVNNESIPFCYMQKYELEGAKLLNIHKNHPIWQHVKCIEMPLVKINKSKQVIRHDPDKLAKCIFSIK